MFLEVCIAFCLVSYIRWAPAFTVAASRRHAPASGSDEGKLFFLVTSLEFRLELQKLVDECKLLDALGGPEWSRHSGIAGRPGR